MERRNLIHTVFTKPFHHTPKSILAAVAPPRFPAFGGNFRVNNEGVAPVEVLLEFFQQGYIHMHNSFAAIGLRSKVCGVRDSNFLSVIIDVALE